MILALLTLSLIGILTYLQLAFQGADVKTAIRLIHEARLQSGSTLGEMIEKSIPKNRLYCSAVPFNEFYGHMDVKCWDTQINSRILHWNVSVTNGQVVPKNEAAEELGRGTIPWQTKSEETPE